MKNIKTVLTPEQTLRRLVDYMPEFYKSRRQLINCIDFLDNREWEFALDSLIKFADETGHYFSEEFWQGISDSASKMNLPDKVKYCRKQLDRNARDLTSTMPFGWTTIKIDETHFQCYISEKLKKEYATERRKEHQVEKFIDKDGVYVTHGRGGFLYVSDKGRIAEIEFELGRKGRILFFKKLTNWSLPTEQLLDSHEKQLIKDIIVNWAIDTKNAITFED
jgi:hypothetical protein